MLINKRGQSVLEIIIAVGIFSLIAASVVLLSLGVFSSNLRSAERLQADMYFQEGVEAVRSIRDYNFANLVDGTHGLSRANGYWEFLGNSDVINQFTRTVMVESVQRDTDCNLISSGGTVDTSSKKVTTTISWEIEEGNLAAISAIEYLNNWASPSTCGAWADCLSVNSSHAYLDVGHKELQGVIISNTCPYDITLEKITITWTNPYLLEQIKIGGLWAWRYNGEGTPQGKQSSGTEIDIVDYILPAESTDIYIDKSKFDASMSGAIFTISFKFADGTSKYAEITPQ